MRLLVHAVRNGEEKNAKWVGRNCFCSLSTIDTLGEEWKTYPAENEITQLSILYTWQISFRRKKRVIICWLVFSGNVVDIVLRN